MGGTKQATKHRSPWTKKSTSAKGKKKQKEEGGGGGRKGNDHKKVSPKARKFTMGYWELERERTYAERGHEASKGCVRQKTEFLGGGGGTPSEGNRPSQRSSTVININKRPEPNLTRYASYQGVIGSLISNKKMKEKKEKNFGGNRGKGKRGRAFSNRNWCFSPRIMGRVVLTCQKPIGKENGY